jgi:hypothetical protein
MPSASVWPLSSTASKDKLLQESKLRLIVPPSPLTVTFASAQSPEAVHDIDEGE